MNLLDLFCLWYAALCTLISFRAPDFSGLCIESLHRGKADGLKKLKILVCVKLPVYVPIEKKLKDVIGRVR